MECIPGGCLEEIIMKYGPLEEEIIKNYLKQTIEVVCYLHSLGISHNNIKADNIFVSNEGTIKLTGFKNYSILAASNNDSNGIIQKPYSFHQFLAPEVFNGDICQTSDV